MELEPNFQNNFICNFQNEQCQNQRHNIKYKNTSQEFFKLKIDFQTQYCQTYQKRYNQLKSRFDIKKPHFIQNISANEIFQVIGTIKNNKQKNSIELEDESGTMKLKFHKNAVYYDNYDQKYKKIESINIITGFIIGLKGTLQGEFFLVSEAFSPRLLSNPIKTILTQKQENYIILISGVKIDQDNNYFNLFKQLILGNLSTGLFFNQIANITRIIFAGNQIQGDFKNMIKFDEQIEELCHNIPLDIMPGLNEPVSNQWPQKQINKIYFPKNKLKANLNSVSNPYKFQYNDTSFIGTSGQNIINMMENYNFSEKYLDYLKLCINFNHLAPTCPDSLNCIPFQEEDPFVLDFLPQVFFMGNSSKFETELIQIQEQVCRVIAIPDFSITKSFAILNLDNFECLEMSIAF